MTRQTLLLTLLFTPILAFAHGGEVHSDGAKPAVSANVAPRAEAHTELFELLVTPANGQLIVYLDRNVSNEPVHGATVEIESGSWKAVAQEADSGSYRAKAPQFAKPGQYPLVFTVQAGPDADLIETTLVVTEPAKPISEGRPQRTGSMWWWVGGALAALGGVSLLLKRRTPRRSA